MNEWMNDLLYVVDHFFFFVKDRPDKQNQQKRRNDNKRFKSQPEQLRAAVWCFYAFSHSFLFSVYVVLFRFFFSCFAILCFYPCKNSVKRSWASFWNFVAALCSFCINAFDYQKASFKLLCYILHSIASFCRSRIYFLLLLQLLLLLVVFIFSRLSVSLCWH